MVDLDSAHDGTFARDIELLNRFPASRVIVVGDLILDSYIERAKNGSTRVSLRPGGAANCALNVRTLGGQVHVLGTVGADAAGRSLIQVMNTCGLDTMDVFVDWSRPTTVKIRRIGEHGPETIDSIESKLPISLTIRKRLLAYVTARLSDFDAVILQGYDKGMLIESAIELVHLCAKQGIPVLADPKIEDFDHYISVHCLKPNRREAEAALMKGPFSNLEQSMQGAAELRARTGCDNLVMTLDRDGLIHVAGTTKPVCFPSMAERIVDPCGAGDSVAAVIALSIAAGVSVRAALSLAQRAAALACRQFGPLGISPDAIRESLYKGG